jgi:hypothetical protein
VMARNDAVPPVEQIQDGRRDCLSTAAGLTDLNDTRILDADGRNRQTPGCTPQAFPDTTLLAVAFFSPVSGGPLGGGVW